MERIIFENVVFTVDHTAASELKYIITQLDRGISKANIKEELVGELIHLQASNKSNKISMNEVQILAKSHALLR